MGVDSLQIERLAQTAGIAGRPDPAADLEARDAKLRQTAEDFEAVFLTEMLGPIFDGLEGGGLFGGGPGERIYRSLMVREYAAAIARSDGIGIADAVQREILKLQEVKS